MTISMPVERPEGDVYQLNPGVTFRANMGFTGTPWYDVTAFGAVGNGIADDTLAIQAAIDAAVGAPTTGTLPLPVRFAVGSVYFPRRNYRITAPLKIYSTLGLSLIAEQETLIKVDGQLSCAWDLNGVAYSRFQGLTVTQHNTNATVTDVWRLDWDPNLASRSTSSVEFKNCGVRALKFVNGFAIGMNSTTLDVSNVYLTQCIVEGTWVTGENVWWQAGCRIGSGSGGNILGHTLMNPRLLFNRRHIYVDGTNVVVLAPQFSHAETDIYATGSHAFRMSGGRSETAERLYEEPGGATYIRNVSISDFSWYGDTINADNRFIKKLYSGSLILDNVQVNAATAPIIYAGATSKPTQIATRGLSTQTAVASAVVKASTGAVNVAHTNYQQMLNANEINVATPSHVVIL